MKKLIVGNWKMNGARAQARDLVHKILAGLEAEPDLELIADFVVCPPFPYLDAVGGLCKGRALGLGAQDCSAQSAGAYTGDVSAAMLSDMDCGYVILGHSERRHMHGETDDLIKEKAAQAHAQNLIAIICVGEKEREREAGQAEKVVLSQLKRSLPERAKAGNTVIAYEPVWAIGTGKTAQPEDVRQMHARIREALLDRFENHANFKILYGGSVKPDNAGALFALPNVDGGLIGGASLKVDQFLGLAQAIKSD